MTTELQLVAKQATPPSGTIDFDNQATLSIIKTTIAADATQAEFAMFIEFCRSTGLNPFKKEIWFIKTKPYTKKDGTRVEARVQMMTGINGFYAIANKHPQYDGMEEITFTFSGDGRIPLTATAKVWRKDRRFASVGVARWDEYFPGKNQYGKPSIWETKPFVMLSKVAESIALRKAFPQELNGLYTQEEMDQAQSERGTPQLAPVKQILAPVLAADELPESFNALPPVDPALKAMRDAIDGEDLVHIGNHLLTTKCAHTGISVRDALKLHTDWVLENHCRFNEIDGLALTAFWDAMEQDLVKEEVKDVNI